MTNTALERAWKESARRYREERNISYIIIATITILAILTIF